MLCEELDHFDASGLPMGRPNSMNNHVRAHACTFALVHSVCTCMHVCMRACTSSHMYEGALACIYIIYCLISNAGDPHSVLHADYDSTKHARARTSPKVL
eukprot:5508128-Pleurochrysis_carterae.AAC.1